MNKTVELVNAWGEYEQSHPGAEIEEFCRYYLISRQEKIAGQESIDHKQIDHKQVDHKQGHGRQQDEQGHYSDPGYPPGGDMLAIPQGMLLKVMARLARLNAIFAAKALEGTGVTQVDEFAMLQVILRLKEPRKSDIINAVITELSSGTDMLSRLKKKNFLTEFADKTDRRSKRVKLTPMGAKVTEVCVRRMIKCAKMLLGDLTDEDVKLCTQLLSREEMKFAQIWQQSKMASFEEIYQKVKGERKEPEKEEKS